MATLTIDLQSPFPVSRMHLAGGTLGTPWNNTIAAFLNGGVIEYSTDSTNWIPYAEISGVTDFAGDLKVYYPAIVARYWRIVRPAYLALSEWRFFAEFNDVFIDHSNQASFSELSIEIIDISPSQSAVLFQEAQIESPIAFGLIGTASFQQEAVSPILQVEATNEVLMTDVPIAPIVVNAANEAQFSQTS